MKHSLQKFILRSSLGICFFLIGVMVSAGKVSAAPSLDYFKVAPANLAGPGWSTISWSVTGALYCEMWTTDSAWLSTGVGHPVPGLGSGAIPVNVTTTYILACTDGAVALNWSATIYVTAPPPIAGSCSPTHYNCSAGSLDNYFEYSNRWEWTCRGLNGGATSPICVEMKPQCSDGADNDSDGKVDMADPGCSSSSDTDETNAPLVAPTGLRVEVDPSNENRITISWDSMPGAEYYSLRVDNTSTFTISDPSKWRYGSGQKHDDCNYDSASDGNILADSVFVAPLGAGVDYCGNVDKTTTSITLYGGVLASSYNHIWIHSRDSSNAFSPASEIFVTLDPLSPTIITATCDASGNTTVSWNAVSVPGGFDRHYSFRLDNQADSWQYDFNNFRTNHDDCVFDNATDANGVLSRPSGSGTDYCGNMRNTSWTGVINPSGTQKAWIHTKSRDFLTFGDRPPSQVMFTCAAGPLPQCSNGVDDGDPEDTLVDMADPGCSSTSDTDETNAPPSTQCSNGVDDGDPEDTLIDMADPGCSSPSDNDETNALVAGIDLSAGSPTPDPSYLPLTAGTSIFRASITNIGTAVANGTSNSTLEVDLDNNGTYDVVGLTATPQITNQGTGAGNAVTVQASYNFTAGNHTVRFCADSTGAISESDEFNNCGAGVMFNFAAVNPFTLCRNTCDSGIVIGKSSIGLNNYPMNVGTTENIVACYNPTDNCSSSSGDVTTSISNWNEDLGSNVISLGSISGSKKPITAGSVGTENWLAQYLGLTVTVGTTVSGLANCSASTISNCILPAGINGNNVSGTCSVVGGSCNYTCVNGSWTTPSSNTCTAPTATPELKATPRLVSYGGSGTLIWDTNGTNEAGCSITGGSLGNSYASLPASGDPYEGSLPVSLIYGKTTYVLSCGTEFSTATFEVPSKGFET